MVIKRMIAKKGQRERDNDACVYIRESFLLKVDVNAIMKS